MKQLYSLQEAAKESGVSLSALTKWLKAGELTHFLTWFIDARGKHYILMRPSIPSDLPHEKYKYAYQLTNAVLKEARDFESRS